MEPSIIIEWETAEPIPEGKVGLSRLASKFRGEDPDVVDIHDESAWLATRVLYAYLDPDDGEILYIGKVWGGDVWTRFHAADKDKIWSAIENEFDLDPLEIQVIVGTPVFQKRSRLTKETLTYLESLLIWHIEPPTNTQSKSSFKCREGTVVGCDGDWPLKQRTFVDE